MLIWLHIYIYSGESRGPRDPGPPFFPKKGGSLFSTKRVVEEKGNGIKMKKIPKGVFIDYGAACGQTQHSDNF